MRRTVSLCNGVESKDNNKENWKEDSTSSSGACWESVESGVASAGNGNQRTNQETTEICLMLTNE